jgi:hypothetical protein
VTRDLDERMTPDGQPPPIPVSLPRLLKVRRELAREVCIQLSHGVGAQVEKLVLDLLRIEDQVLATAPSVYARQQGAWGRQEADLLHVPGDPRASWCPRCAALKVSSVS